MSNAPFSSGVLSKSSLLVIANKLAVLEDTPSNSIATFFCINKAESASIPADACIIASFNIFILFKVMALLLVSAPAIVNPPPAVAFKFSAADVPYWPLVIAFMPISSLPILEPYHICIASLLLPSPAISLDIVAPSLVISTPNLAASFCFDANIAIVLVSVITSTFINLAAVAPAVISETSFFTGIPVPCTAN